MKRSLWIPICLLALLAACLLWPAGERPVAAVKKSVAAPARPAAIAAVSVPVVTNHLSVASEIIGRSVASTNREFFRLSNTTKTLGELTPSPRAILLENALIDTASVVDLKIPAHLRATGEPGAYIVQARAVVNAAFRAALANAGAQIVSYIPNNAYLVQLSAGGAAVLRGDAQVAAVLPFEPYFKLQSSLLGLAVEQKSLPSGQVLTLGLFDLSANQTVAQIEKMGGVIFATDRSPFGPIVRVHPPTDWIALAQLPGVQRVEPATRREVANDLARVTMGITTATYVTNANWLGLSGSNVVVEVNDTGIDATHPDFNVTGSAGSPGPNPANPSRVIGDTTNSLVDTDGHGTHVAGIIAGNGGESYTVISTPSGSVTNADFRGKAPAAKLFSVGFLGANDTNLNYTQPTLDSYLQEMPALTNALISNNSWINGGANEYDLSAASYDAAVRDALPGTTGPQPVLFVFAAGNDGGGVQNNGGGGTADSILSPGTAKNVITVGALEQSRNITNTYLPLGSTNPVAAWPGETDSSSQVAGYSARGNVGIGTEGTYGRFKPDVVAPGSFVVSTRSQQWDQQTYYSPTNYYDNVLIGQLVDTNGLNYYSFSDFGFVVKPNAVGVSLQILNTSPFVSNMPIYVSLNNYPDPTDPTTYDFVTSNNLAAIPPDSGNAISGIQSIINNFGDFNFGVGDSTNIPVTYDLFAQMITTNDLGNYYTVYSNLNNTLGPYYRYETGTSMAAADVSGVLALMQDFFTNTLHTTPSPALLKAMLINGARPTGFYNLQVNNPINFQGWGLVNLPNAIPATLTNTVVGTSTSEYFIDQSPTNALATGDSRTYQLSLSPSAQTVPLRLTLAWTDPPGNPSAAIKLVNNLDLMITNMDSPTNPVVYYGNDIAANQVFNTQENPTNIPANLDTVNNVENIFLPAHAGTNFTIVIYGTGVNVNAVTTQTNNAAGVYAPNIVQDFAFVISSGNGSNTNGFTITSSSAASNPTSDQRITIVVSTNAPLMNQMVGAASPVMATNNISFPTNTPYATNATVTIGQTNQWHFYVVTNNGPTADFTNAAFVTFLPETLATPREGVFADTTANSTRPEADIDLYVTQDSTLTNLNPVAMFNAISNGTVSLSRGGTEFVVLSNSSPRQVYYVGVKSEDQMASEYAFLPEFSNIPFSQLDANGNESVTFFPVDIPDGDPTHPGYTNTIGLAIYPIKIQRVVVTNILVQQNAGDLVVALNHSATTGNGSVVLMNHNSPNLPGTYTQIYDDSGQGDILGSQPADGPGSLRSFTRQEGQGIWILHAADNAPAFSGNISGSLFIQRHQDLTKNLQTVTVSPLSWYYGYVDVPVGYTNITVLATNLTLPYTPPIQLYLNYNVEPDATTYLAEADLTNGIPPGNSISYGPPMQPGRYFVGLYNPDSIAHTVLLGVTLGYAASAITTVDSASTDTPLPLKDDAVTYDYINVTNTDLIQDFNVGLRVDHPRISDLVFHLISPDGTRYLLMENRGGQSTNGCGASYTITNVVPISSNGGPQASTNVIDTGLVPGFISIAYDFFRVPDHMVVFDGTNVLYDTGMINGQGVLNLTNTASTVVTIVMNPSGNTNRVTAWRYTATTTQARYAYLTFTEDASLTTTPIKFATPPFVPATGSNMVALADDFEADAPGIYATNFGGWSLLSTNPVNILTNPAAYSGTNFLAISNGVVAITLPTVAGQKYSLSYALGSLSSESGPATNANWTFTSFTFTAVTNATPLVFAASGTTFTMPGNAQSVTVDSNAVIDTITLTEFPPTLFYQPEQDISGLQGTSAKGIWTLETLDNRAGATNFAPQLLSWNLEFQFANTNFILPPTFVSTPTNVVMIEQTTNFVSNPATSIYTNNPLTYSLVDPPSWAMIDTNTGLITLTPDEADGPTNVTIVTLVTDSHVPPQMVTNSFNVTVLESNRPPSLNFPTNTTTLKIVETFPFTTNAVATDPDIPANQLTFALISATNSFGQTITGLTIATNGLISWTPDETNGPSTNIVVISVTDTNPYTTTNISPLSYSVTNMFTIIVLESNQAPVFAGTPPDTNMDELTLLTVTNAATDADFPTNNLTYSVSISINLAAMAANGWSSSFAALTPAPQINPTNGVITWTPQEFQGPGVYTITTIVTDTNPWAFNAKSLTATNQFSVTVNEVNLPPVPPSIADTTVFELATLTVTNTFADLDLPTNALTYVLSVVSTNPADPAVTNASINPTNGVITWTPTEAQGPGVYKFTTFATDTNLYALTNLTYTATNFFFVTVLETNSAPFWTNSFPTVTLDELTVSNVNATAQDADIPTNTLTYTLTNSPAWAVIDANSGLITLTPLEADGPATNVITVIVTDNGSPALSATTNFTVIVNEVNVAPYWPTNVPGATNYVVNEQTLLTVTNTASDSDMPTNALTYTLTVVSTNLSDPAVTNATIDTNGIITWTPTESQGPGVYVFTTIVTDTNAYALTNWSLSATNSFTVVVNEVNSAPYWTNSFPTVTMNELTTNTVNAAAQDADLPTNTLTYVLTNSPAWASIDTNSGLITLTPLETDGPTTTNVTVVVTDNGLPQLSATTNFTVVVNEVNSAPYWTNSFPTVTMYELATNTINATASDPDLPVNPLTYALTVAVDTNATIANGWSNSLAYATTNPSPVIDTNGVITWAPTELQGPAVYNVTVYVTDTNVYALTNQTFTASNSFLVTVLETNSAPYWTNGFANVTLNESNVLSITNVATDLDLPTNILTYALSNDAPVWASIDTNSGVITLRPLEADGPSTNVITVIVTDNGAPALSTSTNFTVVVNEVNLPPFWTTNVPSQTNYIVTAYDTLIVTNTASDADIPTNLLTYRLLNPTNGVTIDTNTGVITWVPTNANAGTNTITTVVTDFNPYALTNQSLSATNKFTVVVNALPGAAPYAFTEPATFVTGTSARINGMATPNGAATTVWFEWGPSRFYGFSTPPVSVGAGVSVVFVTNDISGLVANQLYHCRLVVSNAFSAVYGFDQMFAAGQAFAWGNNNVGSFSIVAGQTNVPAGLTNATAIAGGNLYSMALKNDFKLMDWGQDGAGGSNLVSGYSNVISMTGSGVIDLGIKTDYSIFGWGWPSAAFVYSNIPSSLTNAIQVAIFGQNGAALKPDGGVVTWGANVPGSGAVPVSVTNIVAIAGNGSCIALRASGTVRVFGGSIPAAPAGLSNVVAIAVGSSHALALKSNGTVVAWGDNTFGQTNVPSDLTNVAAISANADDSMALKSDGTIVMWGDNTYNQTNVPADCTNVFAIASGGMHSLAIKALSDINLTNTPPTLFLPPNTNINEMVLWTAQATATDPDLPTNTLTYTLLTAPSGMSITPGSGIITWTPVLAQAGTINTVTTVVTDNGIPNLSATNSFFITVSTIPAINRFFIDSNGVNLQWTGLTNEQFQVQWTTNLAPPSWTVFPEIITSTNGVFNFVDTNSASALKFYQLILLP